ncbi:capsular polysaccharide export protein [Caldovatus sediminis]|uniref:Capsular polysaccharide export protein n=1 Tax=Caldovatus sediminis TaxID=2041189 RepID=A0A8J3ECL8_9PROT|nr:capsular biosynthesis protein [Caldovatus sediminis]GGG34223.1 capsular polysaccharide export protein [Caldovatus sediminis]
MSKLRPERRRRCFLFLQGLATAFFARLGEALAGRGHAVLRVNFNAGDRLFWPRPGALDFTGRPQDWPAALDRIVRQHAVTDLVMFSDCRPLHEAAIPIARAFGCAVHVFEEGYLRPGWITLERDGVNGHSRLPRDPCWIREQARHLPPEPPEIDLSGRFLRRAAEDVVYNFAALLGRRDFPHWRTHRPWHPLHEYLGWLRRGARRPVARAASAWRMRGLLGEELPYWLLPLQLDGDYQIRRHSPYQSVRQAIAEVIGSFARAAPPEARLVVKGHPLDNGLVRWGAVVRRAARAAGLREDRVLYLGEAPFGPLLERARGVVTVNSTAGMQALAAGKPVATLGHALYDMPGLTWQGRLDAYWTGAGPPDAALVDAFRRVVIARCLIRGGFFSEAGIRIGVESAVQRLEARPGELALADGRAAAAVAAAA